MVVEEETHCWPVVQAPHVYSSGKAGGDDGPDMITADLTH